MKYRFILPACAGLLVLLLLLPKQPRSVRERSSGITQDEDSLKLIQAVEMVNGANPMEGIQILRDIVAKDSANITAQYYLGLFSVKSGQMDKAISRFETVISIDSTFAQAYGELGGIFLQMDSVDKAKMYYEACLRFAPDNLDALFFSARIYEQEEQWDQALAHYHRLLELNTDTVVEQRIQEFVDIIEKKIKP